VRVAAEVPQSRDCSVAYLSGSSASYVYNGLGYVQKLKDSSTGQAYWTANARGAEQHLTQQTAGNGFVTTRNFDPANGRLTSIAAGSGASVQNSATLGVSLTKTFGYNAIGNLTTKTGVGNCTYPAPGQPRPHGVLSISGNTLNTTFSYDPNGNQTEGLGRIITYTSYNKPKTFT